MADLNLKTVLASLASAFLPLRCAAEDHDHGAKVRFRVFGPDGEPLLRMEDVPVHRMCNLGAFATIVREARRRIEARGFKLEPWQAPVAADQDDR